MNTNKASTGEVINLLFVPVSYNNGLSRKRDRHRSPCQVWWFRFYPIIGLSCHSLFLLSPCCQKKNKYLRSERRIIQGIDMCPAVCLDNGRYQKCFVCGDNTDEVPFISRPALSNAISQTIYPRSQRLHHIYFLGAIIVTKFWLKTAKSNCCMTQRPLKKINLNWQSCPNMSFELLKKQIHPVFVSF